MGKCAKQRLCAYLVRLTAAAPRSTVVDSLMDGLVGAVGVDERHHELGRLVHDLRAVGLKQRKGVDDCLLDQIAVLAVPPQVEFSVSFTSTRIGHVVSTRERSVASNIGDYGACVQNRVVPHDSQARNVQLRDHVLAESWNWASVVEKGWLCVKDLY